VSSAIAAAAVAPVLASPSVRAEQTTQLVLGETASVLESMGEWVRLRSALDGYEGWTHRGYLRLVEDAAAAAWRAAATGWSDGVRVLADGTPRVLPLRARVVLEDGLARLPDGSRARLVEGELCEEDTARARALEDPPARWALRHFAGSPYQWGGLTPAGVDCSGLVQTTFLARGVVVPRDSSAQAAFGEAVLPASAAPGDLLFFRSESGGPAITHVAFLADGDTLIHSTIACGGVVHESFAPGSRAGDALRPRLALARRFGA
jgi:hypothetical protein